VDGTPSARAALRCAVDIAGCTAAIVEAVIVWQSRPVYDYGYGWAPLAFTDDGVAAAAANAALRRSIAEVTGDDPPVPVQALVLQGRPTDVLLQRARFADMLIVGSRGHGTVAGIFLDSVSQHCVQRAPCPVLVVPSAPADPPLNLFAVPPPRQRRGFDVLVPRPSVLVRHQLSRRHRS
jgi:nucleotide-binding universal stress UspA family protein